MIEKWKEIPNYENIYEINTKGEIRRINNKILKPCLNTSGYLKVNLSRNGNIKTFMVHQLMGITFFDNYIINRKIVIDHIDNNKINNNLTNLQLISFRKNVSKDRKNCSSKYTGVSWNKNRKKWQVYINTIGKNKFLGYFDNEEEASLKYINTLKIYDRTTQTKSQS